MSYTEKYLKYKTKYNNLKTIMNNKNNSSFIMSGGAPRPTLYLFKAEWCGHCENFAVTWNKLNKELLGKVDFIMYDGDKDKDKIKKCEEDGGFKVSGYPTIILKSNGVWREHGGGRSFEEIKEFINSYLTIKI